MLSSARVVLPDGVRPADVVLDGEQIAAIGPRGSTADALDLGDLVLMPGLVDAHVHVNEPGRTEWEGFETATRAAAAGGITTFADMPLNCIPVTTTAEALRIKLEAATPLLHVDVAFWGGVVPGNAGELEALIRAGVRGCKAFLVHSGIDDFPNVTEADLRVAMPILAAHGVPLLVHAEVELPAPGDGPPTAYRTWLDGRPRAWEDQAIALMIRLCRDTGCAVHIVHLSSASALPMLLAARAEGLPITVETCPHYLCLTAEEVPDGATAFKCAPPIREAMNREGLWNGLREGVIDLVTSDHSPCTPHLKLPERGDFTEAWGGIASLQLGLSTVWTEARLRGFPIADLSRWMSAAPAAFLGLDDRGVIREGARADLVAWDPDATWQIDGHALHHRHPTCAYQGREVRGRVRGTWLAGRRISTDGEVVEQRWGRALLGR